MVDLAVATRVLLWTVGVVAAWLYLGAPMSWAALNNAAAAGARPKGAGDFVSAVLAAPTTLFPSLLFATSSLPTQCRFPIERPTAPLHGLHVAAQAVPNVTERFDGFTAQSDAAEIGSIVRNGVPVVFRSERLLRTWKAMSTWSHEYLLQRLGPQHGLKHVFWSGNRTIYRFQDYSVLTDYPGTARWYDDVTMPAAMFFSRLHEPQLHGYLYLAAPVAWISEAMVPEVVPLSLLSPDEREASVQIWVGSVGVTTQIHYDIDYNFHVQVTGDKRFLLLPPSLQLQMDLYPMPHQYHRRSQLNFDEHAPRDEWERAEQLTNHPQAMEVTLRAGDVLYIPPFWFHYVTNLNAGISVNVWTRATGLKRALYELWRAVPTVPASLGHDHRQSLAFFRDFLLNVLPALYGTAEQAMPAADDDVTEPASGDNGFSARQWLQHHLQQRFARLVRAKQTDTWSAGVCSATLEAAAEPALRTAVGAAITGAFHVRIAMRDAFDAAMGDFVDLVALSAAKQSHRGMAAFLQSCFAD